LEDGRLPFDFRGYPQRDSIRSGFAYDQVQDLPDAERQEAFSRDLLSQQGDQHLTAPHREHPPMEHLTRIESPEGGNRSVQGYGKSRDASDQSRINAHDCEGSSHVGHSMTWMRGE
jgi:hypothetical protein